VSKKDTNYIAAVEKSIAEKYGKETVQDFRAEWTPRKEKEYMEELKKTSPDQFPSYSHQRDRVRDNRSCPVCKTYSFSPQDDLYMNRFKCCHLCYIDFVERNEQEWQEGTRPEKEYIMGILRGRKNGNSTRNS
jgi:hypothetical protein